MAAQMAKYRSEPWVVMAMSAVTPFTVLPASCQCLYLRIARVCRYLPLRSRAWFARETRGDAIVAEVIQKLLPAQKGLVLNVSLTIFHSSTSISYIESAKIPAVYDHIYVSDDIDRGMPVYSTNL
jgi:hypothetical protein